MEIHVCAKWASYLIIEAQVICYCWLTTVWAEYTMYRGSRRPKKCQIHIDLHDWMHRPSIFSCRLHNPPLTCKIVHSLQPSPTRCWAFSYMCFEKLYVPQTETNFQVSFPVHPSPYSCLEIGSCLEGQPHNFRAWPCEWKKSVQLILQYSIGKIWSMVIHWITRQLYRQFGSSSKQVVREHILQSHCATCRRECPCPPVWAFPRP